MSLDFENAETPEETFWRKLPEEKILEYGDDYLKCKINSGHYNPSKNK